MKRWMPFEAIAALRFLSEGRAQAALIVVGVAVGVGVIIFMSALLAGVQANISNRVLSSQAQVVILPPREVARPLREEEALAAIQKPPQRLRSIDQWQKVRAMLEARSDVAAVSPMASGSAFALRGAANRSVTLAGIEPEQYFKIVALPEKIVAGSTRLTTSDILIGSELANDLGVGINDKIRVNTVQGAAQILTVTGILDFGNKSANARSTFVALRTAQALLGLTGGASSIDVNLRDIYEAERVAQEIEAATGLQADSWIKTNEQLFSAIRTQSTANLSIRFFVGLSVAFGIASVLVVSVVQRSKEIGILRAMGASRRQILRVFLAQGAVVGLLGSFAGSLLGAFFVVLWRLFARNADGTPFFAVPMPPMLFVVAAILATLTGLLAAVIPALRASRLDPVAAIRG